jgi:hypothetical protein
MSEPKIDAYTSALSERASTVSAVRLSPTMQSAVDHARQHGGCLVRYPGGFWCRDGLMDHANPWWGTSTVQALVSRGVMTYTEWKETVRSRFPVRAAIAAATGSEQ